MLSQLALFNGYHRADTPAVHQRLANNNATHFKRALLQRSARRANFVKLHPLPILPSEFSETIFRKVSKFMLL